MPLSAARHRGLRWGSYLAEGAADLFLGAHCVSCARPGLMLCHWCHAQLKPRAFQCWPSPVPAGLVAPIAAANYEAQTRAVLVGYKEEALPSLAPVVAAMLATSVQGVQVSQPLSGRVVLVPIASRARSVRLRGFDSTWLMTQLAARLLRRQSRLSQGCVDYQAKRLLRVVAGVQDQAGLNATQRAVNVSGSATLSWRGRWWLRRGGAGPGRVSVIICDDVITTGATAREAQRVLTDAGLDVVGIALIAATQRRITDAI